MAAKSAAATSFMMNYQSQQMHAAMVRHMYSSIQIVVAVAIAACWSDPIEKALTKNIDVFRYTDHDENWYYVRDGARHKTTFEDLLKVDKRTMIIPPITATHEQIGQLAANPDNLVVMYKGFNHKILDAYSVYKSKITYIMFMKG